MAIRPSELLNHLPSAAELLEKPPVRALVDRWNRSSVASNVRTFLDEFQEDLKRRVADVPLPTIRELAERAARYVASRHQVDVGTAINATGQLWGPLWNGVPLASVAIEQWAAVANEFAVNSRASSSRSCSAAEQSLCRLTGAESAMVLHSYSSALWLALNTIAVGREVLVARSEVGSIGAGGALPELSSSANVRLRDVGTANQVSARDYETADPGNIAAVLTVFSNEYRVVGQTATADLSGLVSVSHSRAWPLIAAMDILPLGDVPPELHGWSLPTARHAIAAGIDLAVIRGDGMVGGPACGIILGSRKYLDEIRRHTMFESLRADTSRGTALGATLECYNDGLSQLDAVPIWQLLLTPLDNLRNRAERLAPQLVAASNVTAVTPVATNSSIFPALASGMPSYGLLLKPATAEAEDFAGSLSALPFPIAARIEQEQVLLDLRTILPRQDRLLVESIVGNVGTSKPGVSMDHNPVGKLDSEEGGTNSSHAS